MLDPKEEKDDFERLLIEAIKQLEDSGDAPTVDPTDAQVANQSSEETKEAHKRSL